MSTPQDTSRSTNIRILRGFMALTSLVLQVVGALVFITRYAPERSTRHGMAHALNPSDAMTFGATLILLGLAFLAGFAKSARAATWWTATMIMLALINLAFGARIWG